MTFNVSVDGLLPRQQYSHFLTQTDHRAHSCMLMQHGHIKLENAQNKSIAYNYVSIQFITLKLCNMVNVELLHLLTSNEKSRDHHQSQTLIHMFITVYDT